VLVSDKDDRRGGVTWKADEKAKTSLAGAQFLYAVRRNVSTKECLHPQEDGSAEPTKVDLVSVDGVPYAHASADDGGMCHQENEDVYTAYRNHACYIFDLSVHTVCAGVVDGMRDATPAELAEINAKLLGILKTVQFRGVTDSAAHGQNTIH
jgi:hypothetical protein